MRVSAEAACEILHNPLPRKRHMGLPAPDATSLETSCCGRCGRPRFSWPSRFGCLFAIDTDAHAPGQLDWLDGGCARAELFGTGQDRVINTRGTPGLG
jgi:hypothetical protein